MIKHGVESYFRDTVATHGQLAFIDYESVYVIKNERLGANMDKQVIEKVDSASGAWWRND